MIGQMAGENPDLKTAVDAEAKQTGQSPDPGILEAAKKAKEMFGSAWDKVTGAVKDVMDTIQAIAELGTNVGPLTSKMVTNLIAYCVISLVMLLAYIAFVVVFSYKFLMLFVLFKISLTMYAMFLPPIVMLGIFRHTKTFALNAVRYGIAMLITINLTFPAVQAVFSQSNIKKSIVHALSRNPIGPKETPDGEAMLNQTLKLDVTLSKVMTMPEGMANPFFWAETNVNDMLWGAMSVAEIMFVMAIMAALVLKMYEIVNGTLMGSWNPVSTPIGSGGGSEGSGGGGSDSLQDQAFRYRQAEAAAGKSEK
jgi:magnesium-transporting ATPase (P-type)